MSETSFIPDQKSFIPDQTWNPTVELEHPDAPIAAAIASMNAEKPQKLISDLRKCVVTDPDTNITYGVFRGDGEHDEEYSSSEAIVTIAPFANGATANMLVRNEFLRRVFEEAGVRDASGKLKPVVGIVSPGRLVAMENWQGMRSQESWRDLRSLGNESSNYRLSADERRQVRRGDLGPVAREMLTTVSRRDFGRVSLFGYSQGGNLVQSAVLSAPTANLDVTGAAIGDPSNSEDRSLLRLGADFFKTGSKDRALASRLGGLTAEQMAQRLRYGDFPSFIPSGILGNNLDLYQGLGRNTLGENLQTSINSGITPGLVVAYGGESAIAKPNKIEPILANLIDPGEIVTTIKVDGMNHSWGDYLPLLAKLYLLGVK